MEVIETSKHLYQPPYYFTNGTWTSNFKEAVDLAPDEIHVDMAAIFSYLSFGFVSGNRTLIEEISRQPWLSKLNRENKVVLESIPPHGFYTGSDDFLSRKFFELLVDEARKAVKDFENVYVLLSGGLDSRIVAGVLKHLYGNGELKNKPTAVTWGLEDSRDVVYAKAIAESLDFSWKHAPMSPEILLENIHATVHELGLIHSPELLHNMLWLKKNLPENSLVLAGSFGDSIGRAEFSGKHLLLLNNPNPTDNFKLLKGDIANQARSKVQKDIQELFSRSSSALPYMQYEHFQQGFRMRNGLCNALSIINGNATVYQMFTAPEVFSFIWSLHPSRRDDDIYRKLLDNFFPKLARMPWARTNKALGGDTFGAIKGLRENYHDYTNWMRLDIRAELEELVDPEWFEKLEIFDLTSISDLRSVVRKSHTRVGRTNDIWLWLAGFRVFVDYLENSGKRIRIRRVKKSDSFNNENSSAESILRNSVLNRSPILNSNTKNIRKLYRIYKTKQSKRFYRKHYQPKFLDEKRDY